MRELRAKDIMTKNILKVREDWSVHRLAEFFAENSISGAPVISTDGKLVGVVSLTDIILQNTLSEKKSHLMNLTNTIFTPLKTSTLEKI